MDKVIGIKEVIGTVLVVEQGTNIIDSSRINNVLKSLINIDPLLEIESEQTGISRVEYIGNEGLQIQNGVYHVQGEIIINRFKKCYYNTDRDIRTKLAELVKNIK